MLRLFEPDHERRVLVPGVPGPARRPVDIDQSVTGFDTLRSLRVYRFDSGAVIDGHAEEDEVFVVVVAGRAELSVNGTHQLTTRLAAASHRVAWPLINAID